MNYLIFLVFLGVALCHAFPIYPKAELNMRPMTDSSEGGNSILKSHILKNDTLWISGRYGDKKQWPYTGVSIPIT